MMCSYFALNIERDWDENLSWIKIYIHEKKGQGSFETPSNELVFSSHLKPLLSFISLDLFVSEKFAWFIYSEMKLQ